MKPIFMFPPILLIGLLLSNCKKTSYEDGRETQAAIKAAQIARGQYLMQAPEKAPGLYPWRFSIE